MGLRGTKRKDKYQTPPGQGPGPLLLAVDTSSEMLNIALMRGDELLGTFESMQAHTHASFLLPAIDTLLSSSRMTLENIDLLGLCVGPGSFTGLRVGMAAVKGISAGLGGRPCAAVTSVELLARNASPVPADSQEWQTVVPVIDAKRGEVYFSAFRRRVHGQGEQCDLEMVVEPFAETPAAGMQRLLEQLPGQLLLTGSAVDAYRNDFLGLEQQRITLAPRSRNRLWARTLAEACMLSHQRGEALPTGQLEPAYAREPSIG